MVDKTEPRTETADRRQTVQSVGTSLRILEVLVDAPGPMSLKDISGAIDMAPAKVHRYLASFVNAGMIERRHGETYDLGKLAVQIGIAAMGRLDIVNRTADHLHELAGTLDTTVMLSVWGNRGPTVVRWQQGSSNLSTNLGLGSVLPLLNSATGRIFLAFTPSQTTSRLLTEERRQNKIDDREVEKIKAEAVEAGYASVSQSFIPGLYAASAPVLNWQNEAAAAVTLIGTEESIVRPEGEQVAELLSFTRRMST